MYQFNNLTSNVPNVQTFNCNTGSPITTGYIYRGASATLPSANGDIYQASTTNVKYYKVDINGVTGPTPIVGYLFIFGDGLTSGWINAIITAVVDAGTYWDITLNTAFAGTLTTGAAYSLTTQPINNSWQTWTKPNDAMLIHILCIGGGGGGAGGRNASTGTNKYGGGGGGGSAVTSMYVPAFLIPDTLYVQVGVGGNGGGSLSVNSTLGLSGTTGGTSYVALYPSYTGTSQVGNLLLSANGGGRGSGGGAGGAAGTALTVGSTSPFYLGLGQFTSTAGQAGSNSSISNTAIAVTISNIASGGAGGGGQTAGNNAFNGGSVLSPSPLIPYLTSLSGGIYLNFTKNSGLNGYSVKKPLMYVGGSGGAASTNANGGDGGNGAIGSGGGGGGTCTTSYTSGGGGRGGDGIVIITSYSI